VAKEIEPEAVTPIAKPKSSKTKSVVEGLYAGDVEKSFQVSSYHPDSFKRPYNPDPLVMADYTYGVYEEMFNDDQVNVALNLKKDLVVGSGWHISCEDDDIKKELESILTDEIERPLSDILQDLLQAYDFGFSISEKIFKNLLDGRLALKNIKTRHPSTFLLHTDDHGNVVRYEQRGPNNSIDLDPNSIIHYVNNQRFQNPYGVSDLSAAYQAWLTKRHITRFYAIFLENAAGAKPYAKYDRRAPQASVDEIFQAIKNFQTKTAIVMPKEFEVDFLEANANGGDAYVKGINLFNMFIGRALFIPDLVGFSGSETGGGSLSLGKEQVSLFYKHIFRRREILERLMDQHIVRTLCLYNYGQMEDYPKFKFNPLSDEDANKQAEMWIKGVQGAQWVPTPEEVNHFRTLVKFPESDDVEMKQDQAMAAMGSDKFGPKGKDEKELDEMEEDKAGDKKEFALSYPLSSLPGDYKKKVDFKYADQLLKTSVSKILAESKPIVEDIFEDLYTQLQKKKVIQSQDLSKVENLQLKFLGRMQSVLKKHFRRLHEDAAKQAMNEVKKSEFSAPIANDDFLDFLEQETFKYIGDWSYEITKRTKNELIKAIKDGRPLSSVISVLDDEGKKLSDVSLERYSRTKTTEVFNRGRMEYFESTGVVAAYQYSAIMDDVTSEVCGELNGVIFEKENAPIPPLHFNCRSVLIPITKYEEYKEDKTTNSGDSVGKFLEKNVSDKGFSIYSYEASKISVPKEKKIPQIDDPLTTHVMEIISPTEEHYTYRQNGVSFLKTIVVYTDETKRIIKHTDHKRLDDATIL
jgi:SPP1 gp7 family putative phage head morphogenesis protein